MVCCLADAVRERYRAFIRSSGSMTLPQDGTEGQHGFVVGHVPERVVDCPMLRLPVTRSGWCVLPSSEVEDIARLTIPVEHGRQKCDLTKLAVAAS